MHSSATIKDVARMAGCGVATVSRVMNNSGPASEAIRQRVHEAVDMLSFEFNELGRSLQSRTTRTVGCIVPSLMNPVFADAVQGVQVTVREAGYQLLLTCSDYDVKEELSAARTLLAKQVDGLIATVSDTSSSAGLDLVERKRVPCCLLFNEARGELSASTMDNAAAAHVAASAMKAAGHLHTGFVALQFNRSDRSRRRYEGFCAACASLAMAPPALLEVNEQDWELPARLQTLLRQQNRISAIFASNDHLALRAITAARSIGLSVPADLSVVGFDGIEIGRLVEPTLATIVTDPRAMGVAAANKVLMAIAGRESATQADLVHQFRFRPGGSLAPPGCG